MSKEQENEETNPFEGFNILKPDGLNTPEKVEKTKKKEEKKKEEKEVISDEEKKEKEIADALAKAEREAKEVADKKSKKSSNEEVESTEEEFEEETEQKQEIEEEPSLKPFVSHMAERGILDIDDIEKFEDTEEGLEKVVKQTIEKGVNDWKSSYDEDTQKYLKFIEEGGKPQDFHKIYYNENSFSNMEIDGNEELQKKVIKEGLIAAGWDDEDEIKDEISLYEDSGKLEAKAKSHLTRLQKLEKEQKDLLVQAQEEYAKEQKELQKKEWDEFKKGLFDKEEISGFKFTPKMKEDLWDYMTKVVDKKTKETQYHKDSKEKGAEARYIFAYLMKNNWDATKLSKEIKNKVVSDVKKKLSNYTDGREKIKSGSSKQEEKQETNSFAGFKKILIN